MADGDITENITLWSNDKGKEVTVITDGSDERLAVDALLTGGNFQLQPFTPKSDISVANIALNVSTDTSLKLVTSTTGKVAFIAIAGSNASFEIAIKIDGVETSRITMAELGSGLGLSNATNVPIWVETANKNFRFHPTEAVDFTSSFEVISKATGTPTPTVNWVVMWREAA